MVMKLIAKPVEYSSDSSSIGTPGEEEEEEEEVSKLRGLASMSSLEDSLPTKKGLSNHYKGKSKSFGNLGEIESVKEIGKQENPLNKQRRLQICNGLARRSFCSWQNPKSMPLNPVNEDDGDDEEGGFDKVVVRNSLFKNRALKSQNCYTFLDLIEEEDND